VQQGLDLNFCNKGDDHEDDEDGAHKEDNAWRPRNLMSKLQAKGSDYDTATTAPVTVVLSSIVLSKG
jgi:hypothetical protein